MKKTIVTFGLISGAVSSLMMVATVPFLHQIGFSKGLIVGYTSIVLSFLLVYFGIRSYRDHTGNGQITFAKAFAVGICITLISCLFYVGTWEILYYNFLPDFADKYNAHILEKLKASGASAAAVQAKIEELRKFKESYNNPFYNAAMTFIEPFPVGLLITLISAAVLRRKPQPRTERAALPAA
ncbi:MAG TPA: DUF4199 domain-containing protein [Terriglobales bacterium]|nr:DUF4199 domain-containing protein [Terriglobales bacterium]